MVLGYAVDSAASLASAMSTSTPVTAVSMAVIQVDSTGNVTGTLPASLLASNRALGRLSFACIRNYGTSFDPAIAHSAMVSNRARTVQSIVALAKAQNLDGINLDFEALYPADRDAFTSFVAALAAQLHANGAKLMLSVPPKSSDAIEDTWSWPYDYAALGQSADLIQMMTYGEHRPSGAPGPVAGMDWMLPALQYAASTVPAGKLLLGLPAFGYDWNLATGTGRFLAYKDVPDLLSTTGATPQWDANSRSGYFTYIAADGSAHEAWHETPQGLQAKAQLANTLNLAGISVWALGSEDASFWGAITAAIR